MSTFTASLTDQKILVAKVCLERMGRFSTYLDPRHPKAVIPLHLKELDKILLDWGTDLQVPIPDFNLTQEGIEGTLSFSRTPHFCSIPWEAVWGVVGTDGKGQIFKESVPPDIDLDALLNPPAKPVPKTATIKKTPSPKKKTKKGVKLNTPKAPLSERIAAAGWNPRVIQGGKSS